MKDRKKLLILDLDETLIYGNETSLYRKADFLVEPYYIYKRPFLDVFLKKCFEWFEVAVWTSSTSSYAIAIVSAIFENPENLSFVWARDRCTIVYDIEWLEYYYRKNIKKVKRKGYPLESIIVVDDTPQKWERSYGNLVRVHPFEGDETDNELQYLLLYLEQLKSVENIRSVEKRFWRNRPARAIGKPAISNTQKATSQTDEVD
ncbi:MAG: HAD family hydrolase [Oscillatoriaceae cyanobacterium Prado104]|jgi:RNA polymerase II subunit A small phosphatase-like protein|nr:HAD family hydrolase [Oscillatoriaceae cyanobacterium Prado104]